MRINLPLALGVGFTLVTLVTVPCRSAQAQHQVALHAGGGVLRAFGRTGGYASLDLLPVRLSVSTGPTTIRLGATGWIGWAPLGTGSITRRLIAAGPLVDISTSGKSGIGLFAQAHVQRIQSDANYLTLPDGSPPPPAEDRSGTRAGWAYGGTAGVRLPIGEDIGIRLGLGYLHQTIFPGRHESIWRLGGVVTLGN
jgi:hypothetical protein